MEKEQPKIVLKKCDHCQRVVKSFMLKKGSFYDHYVCLEKPEGEQFHVFKVKSRTMANMELAEQAMMGLGTTAAMYVAVKDAFTTHHPQPNPGGGGPVVDGTPPHDPTTDPGTDLTDFSSLFDGHPHTDGGLISNLMEFLGNLDLSSLS